MKPNPFGRSKGVFRVAQTETEAEILLYDVISSWWGVSAEDFKKELDAITVPTINLRINSPGGDVFDGTAIYNALVAHPARIVTHVDGLAASMASIIALAGDEVRMAENAFFMIHNPWSLVMGNANDLRKEAGLLDKIGGTMAQTYRKKSGQSAEQITTWMDEETWFTGDEAAEAGFVDQVIRKDPPESADDEPSAYFDLSVFANVPDALKSAGDHPEPTIRDLERALRDAGLSQAAAKQYIAAGRAAVAQRDAEPTEQRDVASKPKRVPPLLGF